MTAAATLTLNSGSITLVKLDPVNSSTINVHGNAVVDGVLQIEYDPRSFSVGSLYEILSATTGLSGRYASLQQIQSFPRSNFVFTDIYSYSSPYSVSLVFTCLGINTTNLRDNELSCANYLNENSGLLGNDFYSICLLSDQALKNALDTICPSRDAFANFASQNAAFSFSSVVNSRETDERIFRIFGIRNPYQPVLSSAELPVRELLAMNGCSASKPPITPKHEPVNRRSIWLSGFGNVAHQDRQNQNPSFHFINSGTLIGLDFSYENGLLGATCAYGNSSIDEHRFGKANLNIGSVSLYGTAFLSDGFLEGALWNGIQHTRNRRHVFFENFDKTASSSYNSYQGNVHLGAGYGLRFSGYLIEPFVYADWAFNHDTAYHEHGAFPFNMNRLSYFSSMFRTEAGCNGYYLHEFDWGNLIFRCKASYINKTPVSFDRISAMITGAPNILTVCAFTAKQNLFSPSIELLAQKKSGFFASFLYNAEVGSGFWLQEAMLRFNSEATMRVGKVF